MKKNDIRLVEYTAAEEALNCISHACGAVLSVLIVLRCLLPAMRAGAALSVVCTALYLFGITVMFLASAIYHGLKPGNAKRVFRVIDHSMIFFAVAGTATGCVPAVRRTVGLAPAVLMLCAAWCGAAFGLCVTLFGFEKLKAVQMALYFITALICAACGAKAYFVLPIGAFLAFLGGSTLLIVGVVLYGKGRTKRYFHTLFHLFILAGLFVYWLGIAEYCF